MLYFANLSTSWPSFVFGMCTGLLVVLVARATRKRRPR